MRMTVATSDRQRGSELSGDATTTSWFELFYVYTTTRVLATPQQCLTQHRQCISGIYPWAFGFPDGMNGSSILVKSGQCARTGVESGSLISMVSFVRSANDGASGSANSNESEAHSVRPHAVFQLRRQCSCLSAESERELEATRDLKPPPQNWAAVSLMLNSPKWRSRIHNRSPPTKIRFTSSSDHAELSTRF